MLPRMRRAAVPDELTRGPFTTRAAEAAGVSRSALRGRTWRRLFRDVWVHADTALDRTLWLAAARLVLPVDAVLCGGSALDALGVDVRPQDDVVVHAAFADAVPRQRPGMHLRRLRLAADEVVQVGRWLVTSPLRTAFDCARWFPPVEAVVAIDALAHARLLDLAELAGFARAHPGVRWVRRVATVVSFADARSESPMESRLRVLLVRSGLDGLVPQYVVSDASGRFVARLDLAFPRYRVAVEYDGAFHWKQRREDDRRRDAVRLLGWTVLVVSAEDYYRHPDDVIARVRTALADAAA